MILVQISCTNLQLQHIFVQVDVAPVEEVKSQAKPSRAEQTNVSSNVKETKVHELEDESTETLVPYDEDEETLEINSDEEEETDGVIGQERR